MRNPYESIADHYLEILDIRELADHKLIFRENFLAYLKKRNEESLLNGGYIYAPYIAMQLTPVIQNVVTTEINKDRYNKVIDKSLYGRLQFGE